jgi:acyl transferase domain-containing protein
MAINSTDVCCIDELYRKTLERSAISKPEIGQPMCTAIQIAMVDLLYTWKIRASTVVGHSSGEIAAAYANGAISRESAWMVAYFRGLAVAIAGEFMGSVGSMIAVQSAPEVIEPLLKKHNTVHPHDLVVIACYNSTTNITVSGSRDAVHRLSSALTIARITFRVLKIDVAYHSHHMIPVAAVYKRLLCSLETGSEQGNRPQFVSTVTGHSTGDTSVLRTPDYWISNLTSSVKFSTALAEICASAANKSTAAMADMFLEIGPHSTLRTPLKDILAAHEKDIVTGYTSVLDRNRAADVTALECAGKLYALGLDVDLAKVNGLQHSKCKLVTTLPPYPFNDKTKYWLEGRMSAQYRFRKHVHHEFLGTRADDWNECEARWTNRIILEQSSWLKDHRINGLIIFPAAAFMVMALEAMRQVHEDQGLITGYKMRDVQFSRAVTLSQENRGTELQLTLRRGKTQSKESLSRPTWNKFSIHVYDNEGWVECCSGAVAVEYEKGYQKFLEADSHENSLPASMHTTKSAGDLCRTVVETSDIYNAFARAGLEYGPFFEAIHDVKWNENGEAMGVVDLQQWRSLYDGPTDPHLIHPTALDAILQMTFPAYSIYSKNASATTVPTGFRSAWFSARIGGAPSDSEARVHAKVIERGFRNKIFSITATLIESETPIFSGNMETSTIGTGNPSPNSGNKPLYRIEYMPDVDLRENHTLDLEQNPNTEEGLVYDKELLCVQSMRTALNYASTWSNALPVHLQEYAQWLRIKAGTYNFTITEPVEVLCQRLEHTDVEGRLLARVAQNLTRILTGEVDPLDLLSADKIPSEVYSNFLPNRQLLVRAAEEIKLMAHKNPAMRIIEIGAGTGSTTEHMLEALCDQFNEYVYTDITSNFFLEAKDRFKSTKLTFKTLDVSQNPLPQGYEEGEFDLIIASDASVANIAILATTDLFRYHTPPMAYRTYWFSAGLCFDQTVESCFWK